VEVDESGRHHLPRHVDLDLGRQPGADRRDAVPRDRDVPHRVETGFRVDYPAAA